MSLVIPIVAGITAGSGATMAFAAVLPKGRPELRSVVSRLNSPLQATTTLDIGRAQERREESSSIIPAALIEWLGSANLVRASEEDLAILGKSHEKHVAEKIMMGIVGMLFAAMIAVVAALAHVSVPFEIPTALSIILGILTFFGPDIEARSNAAKARQTFNKVLHGYLVNVALERRANRGIVQALEEAAAVGDSWVLRRIRAALLAAQMANTTAWQALEELGTAIGVQHLVEAAQTMRSASEEGTAVFTRLIAQANSLGDAVLAEERAVANARSERMIVPVSAMGIVVMAAMAYPLAQQISHVR